MTYKDRREFIKESGMAAVGSLLLAMPFVIDNWEKNENTALKSL